MALTQDAQFAVAVLAEFECGRGDGPNHARVLECASKPRASELSMSEPSLRRYTSLVAAIQILRQRRLTLLNPELWDDRNDIYSIRKYMEAVQARSILALCFAQQFETYHHWRVFSQGMDGVCLEFDRERLLAAFEGNPQIRYGSVEYYELRKLREAPLTVEELPFIKRFPYQDEKEFRIVYVDTEQLLSFKDFEIDLGAIRRINLSPWMPGALSDSVKETIRSIPGCENIRLNRSTLVENEQWKGYINDILPVVQSP
ncbi:DUF2971 domain-containing protein [Hyphomicrobium sp.]|uniref:DUF2971 domain-containing protein n=1 Tax=Hyphomicrobium sp. TaxID=82 RepID=UPI002CCA5C1C|nr:DUF2971 domain-containing protein [Hyphomicrobium sp.]HRN87406.1 DUF2971 domain-containing protein [Hyphomicrobium sp.]